MDKFVRVSDVVDWFRAYGHFDQDIPFETLVTDLRDSIPAADVAPRCLLKREIDAKRLFELLIKIRLRMNEIFKDNQEFVVVVSKEAFDVLKGEFNSPENPDCNDPDFTTLLAMRVTHWGNEK